jgi:hypothetical protein
MAELKNSLSEHGLSSLRRQVSLESENVLSQLSQSLIEEKVFLALQSINLASATGRITLEDAKVLKTQMVTTMKNRKNMMNDVNG